MAVEDIYSMLSKRSQVEDVAMEEVLGELMDHHIIESNKKSATYKRGQPSGEGTSMNAAVTCLD